MQKSRFFLIGLAMLVLSLAFTSLVAAQDTVTLTLAIAASPAEADAVQLQIDAFQEANPGITVNVQALPEYDTQMQTSFASGDYPNVFYVGQSKLAEYADAGVLAPADENISDVEGIYPALVTTFTFDGTLYCPAKDFSVLALEYNKDLFDAAGLEYPTADWTWDDLSAAAAELATDDVAGFVINPDIDRWFALYVQAGGTFYDADGNFVFGQGDVNSQAALDAINFIVDLYTSGAARSSSDLGAGWPGEAFGRAQTAMTMEGNWIIGYMLEQFPDINWGVTQLPAGSAEGTLTFTVCLAVAADNTHPDESWQLVNFLTDETGAAAVAAQGFGPMPARPSAGAAYVESWAARTEGTGVDNMDFQAFVDAGEVAVAPITPPGFQEFRAALGNALLEAVNGNMTAEEVLAETIAVIEDLS